MWYASFVLLAAAIGKAEECTYALELVQVQDGSSSFDAHIELMRKTTQTLVASLSKDFGEFRYGVTSFVDKPIPTRGLGFYGNYASLSAPADWCFRLEAPLTEDPADIAAGLGGLGKNMGSGGDFPENPYEGMLFAAYNKQVGWSPASVTHAPSGRPIARIMIMFTDDVPHLPNDAYAGTTTAWNWPRDYTNYEHSTGGFGSRSWGTTNYIFYRGDDYPDRRDYVTMSNLFRSVDNGETLNATEVERLDALIEKFGPYPWPEVLDHPGDDSVECDKTEYPSLQQVGKALQKHKITPIILLARPSVVSSDTAKRCRSIGVPTDDGSHDVMDCLVEHYSRDLDTMGVFGVVDTISSSNVLDQMIQAISKATEAICNWPSTTEMPEDPTTETSAQTQTTTAKDVKSDSTTIDDDSTAVDDDSTAVDDDSTAIDDDSTAVDDDSTAVDDDSTAVDDDSTAVSDDSTETDTSATDPVVTTTDTGEASSEESSTDETTKSAGTASASSTSTSEQTETTTSSSAKGSTVPIIAGAAGGAAAVGAAAAGLLYKKFGMSMFGGQGTPDASLVQQVDTPESPVERETIEEVTMDMFQ